MIQPPMTVGSLFAGIGGLELGLERAGMTTKWQVEINPFSLAVLEKHWPNVKRYSDVRDVGAHNLEPVDLICGGFPCQDISQAGRGVGISGSRSGLWGEFARIVGELRPNYVLVENVPVLKSRGLEVVLSDLAACGYDAEWDCIPAIAVGAPHRRDRLFLVAYPDRESPTERGERSSSSEGRAGGAVERGRGDGESRPGQQFAGSVGASADVADPLGIPRGPRWPSDTDEGTRGRDAGGGSIGANPVADATGQRRLARGSAVSGETEGWGAFGGAGRSSWWLVEPDVGRVAHGVPSRVDRLTALGNAVVPQVAEFIGRRILEGSVGR